jgi:predicted RNA-binding protein YlqC (UPF0109 family)
MVLVRGLGNEMETLGYPHRSGVAELYHRPICGGTELRQEGLDLTLTTQETDPMKDLLIKIVQAVVDNPEQVSVSEIEASHTTVLELRVAKEDMGRVIGKQGRMANAIRVLLNAASGKTRKRHVLKIVD